MWHGLLNLRLTLPLLGKELLELLLRFGLLTLMLMFVFFVFPMLLTVVLLHNFVKYFTLGMLQVKSIVNALSVINQIVFWHYSLRTGTRQYLRYLIHVGLGPDVIVVSSNLGF